MSTVAFLSLPAHGHTNPTLALVRELVARGERVLYFSIESFRARIESAGAVYRPYTGTEGLSVEQFAGNVLRTAALLLEVAERFLPPLLAELRADPPDYIIHDSMCVWGKYAARILGVPAVSSVTTFVFGPENRGGSATFQRRIAGTMLAAIPALLRRRRAARRLERAYGLRNEGLLDAFRNQEPLNIVYTSRDFQPGGEAFDDSFKFVGPSIMERGDVTDLDVDTPEGRTLIYVSLGTVTNLRGDIFRMCLEILGRTDNVVVLSVGQGVDIAALGPVPPNAVVRRSVAQLEILRRADLFITHGGMNSVHEGLYYGVPLVVIPQTPEQDLVAERVAAVGAGIRLAGGLTPAVLAAAVAASLGDTRYREASRRIGVSMRAAGGHVRAADEILAFTGRVGGPPRGRGPRGRETPA